MPRALSIDLRQRILSAWQAGDGKLSLSRRFQVSYAAVKRYIRQFQEQGQVEPKPRGGGHPRAVDAAGEVLVRQWLQQQSDLTDVELAQRYTECTGQPVSKAAMNRTVRRLGLTRKKSPSTPSSRTAPKSSS